MKYKPCASAVVFATTLVFVGCTYQGKQVPGCRDVSSNASLTFQVRSGQETIRLSPAVSSNLLSLLRQDAVYWDHGDVASAPYGTFSADARTFYLYHVFITDSLRLKGRVWRSAWTTNLQRLIDEEGVPQSSGAWNSMFERASGSARPKE
jgi:hypothetical protein